jgi:hypothetical protein
MDRYQRKLTEDQEKALEPTVTKLREAFEELRDKLSAMGLEPGAANGTPCLLCDCPDYEMPRVTQPPLICARRTCNHGFTSHDIW